MQNETKQTWSALFVCSRSSVVIALSLLFPLSLSLSLSLPPSLPPPFPFFLSLALSLPPSLALSLSLPLPVYVCQHSYARDLHPPVHSSASLQRLSRGEERRKETAGRVCGSRRVFVGRPW